jgi:hypothetical protein
LLGMKIFFAVGVLGEIHTEIFRGGILCL